MLPAFGRKLAVRTRERPGYSPAAIKRHVSYLKASLSLPLSRRGPTRRVTPAGATLFNARPKPTQVKTSQIADSQLASCSVAVFCTSNP